MYKFKKTLSRLWGSSFPSFPGVEVADSVEVGEVSDSKVQVADSGFPEVSDSKVQVADSSVEVSDS